MIVGRKTFAKSFHLGTFCNVLSLALLSKPEKQTI